jgi:hypothetical protein
LSPEVEKIYVYFMTFVIFAAFLVYVVLPLLAVVAFCRRYTREIHHVWRQICSFICFVTACVQRAKEFAIVVKKEVNEYAIVGKQVLGPLVVACRNYYDDKPMASGMECSPSVMQLDCAADTLESTTTSDTKDDEFFMGMTRWEFVCFMAEEAEKHGGLENPTLPAVWHEKKASGEITQYEHKIHCRTWL